MTQATQLGYDYYILGHDHTPHDIYKSNSYEVYRIGSLSRGTASEQQLVRENVYILEYEEELDKFNYIQVPCLPIKDVFKESVLLRKEQEKEEVNMDELLDNLIFKSDSDIYGTLNRLKPKDNIKKIIEQYLESVGIYK